MKKDGKYRFSLQWPAETDEQIMVGDFLERLGNKKSEFVVKIVCEYILSHSETLLNNKDTKITIQSVPTHNQIIEMIKEVIDEKVNNGSLNLNVFQNEDKTDLNGNVSDLLDNLKMFEG